MLPGPILEPIPNQKWCYFVLKKQLVPPNNTSNQICFPPVVIYSIKTYFQNVIDIIRRIHPLYLGTCQVRSFY